MQYKKFGNSIIARFDKGEEICECIKRVCTDESIGLNLLKF